MTDSSSWYTPDTYRKGIEVVNPSTSLPTLVEHALEARSELLQGLHQTETSLYRVFHGATEGHPGLTVDRYGPNLLIQSWREIPPEAELREVRALVSRELGQDLGLVCYDRSKRGDLQRTLVELSSEALVGTELGVKFDVELVHRGIDPLLFLDFRAARRLIRERAAGKSVLNLFAYTCGVGVAAAVGGAKEVLNVDFAQHALDVGRRNAELNEVGDAKFRILREDCLPVLRQLSGLGVKGKLLGVNLPDLSRAHLIWLFSTHRVTPRAHLGWWTRSMIISRSSSQHCSAWLPAERCWSQIMWRVSRSKCG